MCLITYKKYCENPNKVYRLYKGEKYIRCAECGILVKQTSKNRKYCKDCLKNNPYYTPMETKIVKCVDCGKEFEVDAVSRRIRCDECFIKERQKHNAEMYLKRNQPSSFQS